MDIDIYRERKGIKIGILTSGGDSQGMNAAVRAAVRAAIYMGADPYMIHEGYYGLILGGSNIVRGEWDNVPPMSWGGTVIGSARCKEAYEVEGRLKIAETLIKIGIHSLIIIGGDGSLTGGNRLRNEWSSLCETLLGEGRISKEEKEMHPYLSICGIVGSIDNDMCGTDFTLGANTSLQRILEAVDSISTSAASHKRAFIVEVMGRHCGWLALMAAIASEADYFFIPERPSNAETWRDELKEAVMGPRKKGKRLSIVIISEGAIDSAGEPIKTKMLTELLTNMGLDARATVLGHVQRGGTPSAFDRILGTSQGAYAVNELIKVEKDNKDSIIIGVQKNRICAVKMMDAVSLTKGIATLFKEKRFEEVFKCRGALFSDIYRIAQSMILNQEEKPISNKTFAVVNVGAPACGNNSFFHTMVRQCIRNGDKVLGIQHGIRGLLDSDENIKKLDWLSVNGWVSRASSELGADRYVPTEADIPEIINFIEKYNVSGIAVVGGYEALSTVRRLAKYSEKFTQLKIPILCIPSTLSNNVPGTIYSIGCDTALNTAVSFCDTLRRSASSTRRVFLVELQGGNCDYLSTLSAIGSGASFAYTPDSSVFLKDILRCSEYMHERFKQDNRNGRIIIVSDKYSKVYTTETLTKILSTEGRDVFDARSCVPGHLLQGCLPTPYDRVLGARYAMATIDIMNDMLKNNNPKGGVVGQIMTEKIGLVNIEDLMCDMNDERRCSHNPWWVNYKTLFRILSGLSISDEDMKIFDLPIVPVISESP